MATQAQVWKKRIAEAQKISTYLIGRHRYDRIPHEGYEGEGCGDCAVKPDQLHVPGCDIEQCPKCGGQAIGCECPA